MILNLSIIRKHEKSYTWYLFTKGVTAGKMDKNNCSYTKNVCLSFSMNINSRTSYSRSKRQYR